MFFIVIWINERIKYVNEVNVKHNYYINICFEAWTCSSATAVIKYRLQYRRFQVYLQTIFSGL